MKISVVLRLFALPACIRFACADDLSGGGPFAGHQDGPDTWLSEAGPFQYAQACPDYTKYATRRHKPFSDGPLSLPYQRPHPDCRKFTSPAVEQVIQDLYPRFKDRDLAHLFQNAFPNTLDTTVLWHVDGRKTHAGQDRYMRLSNNAVWKGAQSFIVTGDINAEWLRDSTNQLAQYQALAATAPDISNLIKGAIATQAEFVIESPYCNAFQPPNPSGLAPTQNRQGDTVHPIYEPSMVFECKYELDSLAAFLSLSNQYYANTNSTSFLNNRWFMALRALTDVLEAQSRPTFTDQYNFFGNQYTFSRWTNAGTETLPLNGLGNPMANHTGLVRSAFRPSDDAAVFPFLIPANAMMSVELGRAAQVLLAHANTLQSTDPEAYAKDIDALRTFAEYLSQKSARIRTGILDHGTTIHPKFGKVFVYETDGYGSHLLMDDANIPSLLSLPLLGFISSTSNSPTNANDETAQIYKNTRRMLLDPPSNPYYLVGPALHGIGSPHTGLLSTWPISLLVQAMTSAFPAEILDCLSRVKRVSIFGLINESVDVRIGPDPRTGQGMTRPWFAWANSVFAQAVLKFAAERPELLFEQLQAGERYVVGKGWVGS